MNKQVFLLIPFYYKKLAKKLLKMIKNGYT